MEKEGDGCANGERGRGIWSAIEEDGEGYIVI